MSISSTKAAQDYTCTMTFGSWCPERSGSLNRKGSGGQNLPHQCGESVRAGESHPSTASPHVCSACREEAAR